MAVDRFYTKPPQVVDGSVAFAVDVNGINDEAYLAFTNVASELDAQIDTVRYWALLAEQYAASLPEGSINDAEVSEVNAWSSQKISNELSSVLPDQDGNEGKFIKSSGGFAIWSYVENTILDYQEFTTSGTWTKPAGTFLVIVEAIGGGGAGGKRNTNSSGGGGGGFNTSVIPAEDVAATVTVTIGEGGDGTTGIETDGTDGGSSSFGSHLVAGGGKKAERYVAGSSGSGHIGGSTNNGKGGYGGFSGGGGGFDGGTGGSCVKGGGGGGGASTSVAGAGGISQEGGNGGVGSFTSDAGSGVAPGGGGGGCTNTTTTYKSGDGASGIVRVWSIMEIV